MSAVLQREARAGRAPRRAQPPAAAVAAARPCPAACSCGWRPTRSSASRAGLDRGSIVVSSTNGKTTTAGMIAGILRAAGRDPVHNRAGSNMHWGVATALLEQHGRRGPVRARRGLAAPRRPAAAPRLLVLGNLFRDQLDRYGELERLADEWAELVESLERDVRVRALRRRPPDRRPRPRQGPEPARGSHLLRDRGHEPGAAGAPARPRRQALPPLRRSLLYERAFVGHLGHYTCPNCDADRPTPDVAATSIELHGMSGSRVEITTPEGDLELRPPPPRPLQRLQRARRDRRPGCARASRWRRSATGWSRSRRCSAGSRRSRSRASRSRSC